MFLSERVEVENVDDRAGAAEVFVFDLAFSFVIYCIR